MKVAIIGASGYVGSAICAEALARGHEVTALVRDVARLASHPHLSPVSIDINDASSLAAALVDHPVVVHAFNPGRGRTDANVFDAFVAGHRSILKAVQNAGVERLLCVGGAASLKTRDGVPLIDSPDWPREFEPFRDSVRGTRELYYLLQETQGIDWVFLAPSAMLVPGQRTGLYRKGIDHLIYDGDGKSWISTADFAVAMIDELENPAHHRKRFTVGY
jgi:uncharacterized protein